jgi:hypothetical protein
MKRKILAVTVVMALAAAGTAEAIKVEVRAGDLIVVGNGGFRPTKLPRNRDAPITIYGGGRIKTVSGGLPPTLNLITFEWDRHGSVQTRGLPFCRRGQLESTTAPAARRACGRAIVGKGRGKALVVFPEQKPFPVESPITVFNGPRKGRNPTIIAHAYTTVPVPTTYIVPVVIEKINKGVYGYRTKARIPRIANGAGIPVSGRLTVGKRWTFKGRRHSFVNARCETGRLQARGQFGFNDGTLLKGTFFAPCQVRR